MAKIVCWIFGHNFHYSQAGKYAYRFCIICDKAERLGETGKDSQ